jgi:hypothetical protein
VPKVVADRTGDVLRVVCPHSGFRNEFPDLRMVHVFLCEQCGEAVAVEELTAVTHGLSRLGSFLEPTKPSKIIFVGFVGRSLAILHVNH